MFLQPLPVAFFFFVVLRVPEHCSQSDNHLLNTRPLPVVRAEETLSTLCPHCKWISPLQSWVLWSMLTAVWGGFTPEPRAVRKLYRAVELQPTEKFNCTNAVPLKEASSETVLGKIMLNYYYYCYTKMYKFAQKHTDRILKNLFIQFLNNNTKKRICLVVSLQQDLNSSWKHWSD